ncbi:hypothetical protein [Thermomonas carbonis]|uniref:Uncharacterized protein n=1 Tax=Thermomonas carbonis TaxID=1463158 RepID=A0A7G9SQI3_9GAMM|nr:hypothetical protein [Thermomonas carbonis]QNN70108.1 hypothetical protein H9L16_00140 [Thermomonas carbonis]GHB97810.1 hypothetical protein GCM10010080_07530 [Thermomonas carbonis]
MKRPLCWLLAASAALPGAVRADDSGVISERCRAAGARYALQSDPAFRIDLEVATRPDTASDLQLRLHTPRAQHLFAFTVSNGYATTRLLPFAGDAATGMDTPLPAFHAFASDMTMQVDPPQAHTQAPVWLFVPELGSMLWYGLPEHADTALPEREAMPTGLFKRVACTP